MYVYMFVYLSEKLSFEKHVIQSLATGLSSENVAWRSSVIGRIKRNFFVLLWLIVRHITLMHGECISILNKLEE